MGIEVLVPDVNRLASATSPPSDRRRRPSPGPSPSGCRPCATSARAWSPRSSTSATPNGPFADFYDFCERVDTDGAQQAHHRVAHQGRGLRLARPHAVRACSAASSGSSTQTVARRRKEAEGQFEPVRWPSADPESARRSTSATPIPDVEFDKRQRLAFEKEMLGLYVSDHPLMGAEASLRRRTELHARRARGRRGRPHASSSVAWSPPCSASGPARATSWRSSCSRTSSRPSRSWSSPGP